MSEIDELLDIAINEIGYKEKTTNSNLDSKTANAGSANFTKYGRDLMKWLPETGDTYGVNYEWCDQFVDWCFIKAFGITRAKELLYGWSAYTPVSAQYFKNNGKYDKIPKRGDVVFFYSTSKGRIGHTGIVEKVSGSTIYTIEGNTSNQVARHSYNYKTSSYVNGFGHPSYKDTTVSEVISVTIPKGIYYKPIAKGTVTATTLNVRKWAGTRYEKLTSIPYVTKGTIIEVCSYILDDNKSKWYYARIDGLRYGFVCAKYVEVSEL